jgi:hypothetical protein
MALKQNFPDNPVRGEQLTFKAFELAEAVAALLAVEADKKETNDEFNVQIKAYKKRIVRLSDEIKQSRKSL